ncbi:vanillate O-demethylase ferredoxin subunit [Mesorhizobium sp. YR577]|nr:vanillate O-demethylase ferredoxin subunit [Mesorhizobium sp. YR577]
MNRIPIRVRSVRKETAEIRSFELESIDGSPLPAVVAGAHVDIHLPSGLTRQYSLCNGPGTTSVYLLAVKLEAVSRGGSAAMHALATGDMLEIGAPRDNFSLIEGSSHDVLIAGGIGITPLLSMARHLVATGRSFKLHCFARSMEHVAFRELLGNEPLDRSTSFHLSLDHLQSEKRLRDILSRPPAGAQCYICGPAAFISGAQIAAGISGWPAAAVHVEHFSASTPSAGDGAFDVFLTKTGSTVRVEAEESILQALGRAGVLVETSCEMGICGTCLATVLQGVPDHRDEFLTDGEKAANDRMCLCVSRSREPLLVLDL